MGTVGTESREDALDTIVMRKLMRILGRQINDLTVWLDGEYGPRMQQRIDDFQSRIDRVREWVRTQPDKDVRKAYSEWLDDYFQRGVDEAREEIRTKAKKHEHDQYKAEQRQRRDAVNSYAESHSVPEPTL